MKESVVVYLGLISYFVAVSIPLVVLDSDLFVASTLLLGVPAVWFACKVEIDQKFLSVIVLLAFLFGLSWQLVGHATGAWYEITQLSWRLFGVVSLESLWYSSLLFGFLILAYEYFVDDTFTSFQWSRKNWYLGAGLLAVFAVSSCVITFSIFVPFAYATVLMFLLISTVVVAFVLRGAQSAVIEKVLLGVMILLPPLLIFELVALMNFFWVFAFDSQYLASVAILGETVPVEKLLSIVLVPTWLLLLHEWFFDDAS